MTFAVVPRVKEAVANDNALSDRNQVLARYRQLREIGKRLHHETLRLVSADALLRQARRLGLARGKTLMLEDMDEMFYVYDLAIHTAPAGRTRAIDRYARSARYAGRSDEALVLQAMQAAHFAILAIERRHETAGVVATDLFRRREVWLVDNGLEISMSEGDIIATRLFAPERFSMTAGIIVPFDKDMFEDTFQDIGALLPGSLFKIDPTALIDDRRFAEAVYTIGLADGVMDRIRYLSAED